MKKIVITRHKSLIDYLAEIGLIHANNYELYTHASPEVVTGKEVIGVLPHSLSCLCKTFTEVPLMLPAEKRGQELTLNDLRKFAGKPVTYTVSRLEAQ